MEAAPNIFTDGSKLESGDTGCAFVVIDSSGRQDAHKFKLASCCTVFQAEMYALDAALRWVSESAATDVTIYTDSQSSVSAIMDRSNVHPLVASSHRTLAFINNRVRVNSCGFGPTSELQATKQRRSAAKEAAMSSDATCLLLLPHLIR